MTDDLRDGDVVDVTIKNLTVDGDFLLRSANGGMMSRSWLYERFDAEVTVVKRALPPEPPIGSIAVTRHCTTGSLAVWERDTDGWGGYRHPWDFLLGGRDLIGVIPPEDGAS